MADEKYEDPQNKLRAEIRARYPGLAKSPAPRTQAKLFCIECMGGSLLDARACESRDCFLWPLWMARIAQCDQDRALAVPKPLERGLADRSLGPEAKQ